MPEWLQIVLRALLFIIFLFIITKLVGKKQIVQMTFFDYISGITIGSIAAELITGLERNIFHGLLGISVFGIVTMLADYAVLKSKKLRNFVDGRASIFIKNGKVLEDSLKKERYTIDDLNSLLRKKNVFNVADVEFAVLEPTGDLSVFLKKENQPLTQKDINSSVKKKSGLPQTVIMEGNIIYDSLQEANLTKEWLLNELKKKDVQLEEVFIGTIDGNKNLYVDKYED